MHDNYYMNLHTLLFSFKASTNAYSTKDWLRLGLGQETYEMCKVNLDYLIPESKEALKD
jgi:hypothetical protein